MKTFPKQVGEAIDVAIVILEHYAKSGDQVNTDKLK